MDVGNPSNFIRILEIFHHQFPELKNNLSSFSVTDEETLITIKGVFEKDDYTLDPHGAVGYLALEKYLTDHPNKKGLFLETAHPVKFPDAVEKMIGKKLEIPLAIRSIMSAEKNSIRISPTFNDLRDYLLS
jgi:threonine synthase